MAGHSIHNKKIFILHIPFPGVRNRRLQLEALSHLIQLLPVAHRDTLYVLLQFLSHVIKCSQDTTSSTNGSVITTGNKMDAMNLATIMAPNILPTETDPTLEELDERLDVINVIRYKMTSLTISIRTC